MRTERLGQGTLGYQTVFLENVCVQTVFLRDICVRGMTSVGGVCFSGTQVACMEGLEVEETVLELGTGAGAGAGVGGWLHYKRMFHGPLVFWLNLSDSVVRDYL